MGNTEGTSKPEDSVETCTGRPANISDLSEVCKTVPNPRELARHYGVTVSEVTAELKRQGIVKFTRRDQVDWTGLEELYEKLQSVPAVAMELSTTVKIVWREMKTRGIERRPRGHVKGQKKTQSWREASAKHWDDPDWREEQRQKWLERLPSMRGTGRTSPPEEFLQNALRKANISFTANLPLLGGRYTVDIHIEQKPVIIEADGSSHWLPEARRKDAQRDEELKSSGYQVFRFSYRELDDDADKCVRYVIDSAGLLAEEDPVFITRSDKEAFGDRVNQLRKDPEWRARWIMKLREGQQRRREREQQDMIQSGLHEPREDMQN